MSIKSISLFAQILFVMSSLVLAGCSGGTMSAGGSRAGTNNIKKKGGGNGSDDGTLNPDDGDKAYLTKPKFAMMARDLRCGMCHLRVNGDIVSTSNVMSFEPDNSIPAPGNEDHIVNPFRMITLAGEYNEVVNGTWYIKGTFPNDRSRTKMKLTVTGGIKENYTGIEIPANGFPSLSLSEAERVATGNLTAGNVKIDKIATTNVVLDGTSSPIQINGEVFVKGDVVIFGTYQGRGTIYASGNIYLPGSIAPSRSAFPFPSSKEAAMEDGRRKAEDKNTDALALAAKSSIIVGNPAARVVEITPSKVKPPVADKNVFSWFSGGQGGYTNLVNRFAMRSYLIEAFIYAEGNIAGKVATFTINGGMMCDSFHILGSRGVNQVNYDYRFAGGLEVLEALKSGFTP
jgi:hypothetical protein